jgi:hypothetical protein
MRSTDAMEIYRNNLILQSGDLAQADTSTDRGSDLGRHVERKNCDDDFASGVSFVG